MLIRLVPAMLVIYSVVGASFRDEAAHIRFFGAFDSLEATEAGMQDRLLSCDKCWICKSVLNKCAPNDDIFVGIVGNSATESSSGSDADSEKELGHEHRAFLQSVLRRTEDSPKDS